MKYTKERVFKIAQAHHKKGLAVIPTKNKIPLISEWQFYSKECPSDEKFQRDMKRLQFEFGIVLGKSSGLVAIDIDTDDEEHMTLINKEIPKSPVTKRGERGETRFFKYNNEKSGNIKSGKTHILDILSDKKQTVVPPSIHPKTQRPYRYKKKVTLLNYDLNKLPTLPHGSIERLKNLFSDHEQIKNNISTMSQGRNDQLKSMAVAMLLKEMDTDEIVMELLNYDEREHKIPLFGDKTESVYKTKDSYENALLFLNNIKRSLIENEITNSEDSSLKVLTLGEYFEPGRFPEPVPIIKGLLNKQELHICSAPAKAGKTLLQLNIAIAVAKGDSFLGHFETVRNKVLILQTEVSPTNFLGRLKQVTGGDIKNFENSIIISTERIKINEEKGLKKLKNAIEKYKPGLVILDPLYTLHSLNEDSSTDMGPLMTRLMEVIQTSDSGCLLIHHQGKNPNGHRGSSSLSDAPDGNWSLNKGKVPKEATLKFELRNSESPETLELYLQDNLQWQSSGFTIVDNKNLSLDDIANTVSNEPGIRRKDLIKRLSSEFELCDRTVIKKITKALNNGLINKIKRKNIRGYCYVTPNKECNNELP